MSDYIASRKQNHNIAETSHRSFVSANFSWHFRKAYFRAVRAKIQYYQPETKIPDQVQLNRQDGRTLSQP